MCKFSMGSNENQLVHDNSADVDSFYALKAAKAITAT